jgi:hypothetical protein
MWKAEDNNHFGTGTLNEVLNWIEHCNYDGETFYANFGKISYFFLYKKWEVKYLVWKKGGEPDTKFLTTDPFFRINFAFSLEKKTFFQKVCFYQHNTIEQLFLQWTFFQ